MKTWIHLSIAFVLVFGLASCEKHLRESMKAESTVHDIASDSTKVDSAVNSSTTAHDDSTSVEKKTEEPTVTDTEVTIHYDATAKKPAKTVVIKKHQVTGQKAETKVTAKDFDSTSNTQEKMDASSTATSTHDVATKVEAKKEEHSKPRIPLSLGCAGGGIILVLVLIGLMIFMPGFLPMLLGRVISALKTFWQKFLEE